MEENLRSSCKAAESQENGVLSVGRLSLCGRLSCSHPVPDSCLVTYQERRSYPLQKSISRLCLRRLWGP